MLANKNELIKAKRLPQKMTDILSRQKMCFFLNFHLYLIFRKKIWNNLLRIQSVHKILLDYTFVFLLEYKSCKSKSNIRETNKTINVTYPLSDGWAYLLSFFVVRKDEI